MNPVNRGEVWTVDTEFGPKPYLIVSNQPRNRNLDTVLGVRITTSPNRPSLPTIVPIEVRGTVVGSVLCDEITLLHKDELRGRMSDAFPPKEMGRICEGLIQALACDR